MMRGSNSGTFLQGAGNMWSYERLLLYGGGFLWIVLSNQSDVGCSGVKLRGGSGDNERGESVKSLSGAILKF